MSATELMVLAFILAIVGRWAHNQKAIAGAGALVEIIFALLVVSLLDHGKTAPLAMGFAWLFLAAVLLSNNSPLTGLAKIAVNAPVSPVAGAATGASSGGAAVAGGAAGAAASAKSGGGALITGITG